MLTWTEKDTKYLRRYYPYADREDLCKTLNRSWNAIMNKAKKLNIRRMVRGGSWTSKELEYLRKHYPWEDRTIICERLKEKDWKSIRRMAHKLKVRRRVRYGVVQWKVNRNIHSTDAAYIAGFLDGEGCLSITLATVDGIHYAYPICDITNTDYEVLEWICQTIGQSLKGSLSVRKRPQKTHRDGWELRIRGRLQMVVLLRQLLPYLKVKKRQAKLLLEYMQSDTTSRSIKALKYALAVREATDSYRETDIKNRERLRKIITELEHQTNAQTR